MGCINLVENFPLTSLLLETLVLVPHEPNFVGTESSLEGGGVDRRKLKFTNFKHTSSRG
jgi:hypothetical protein